MKIRSDDLAAVMECDPAVIDEDDAKRFHTGLHAVSMYRESHELWLAEKYDEAREINYEAHKLTGADIHPGATIGEAFFIDHATGVVIGETSVIGDHVIMYQGVTLGGVSSNKGKRHPTIGDHVVLGASSIVLGNITIGNNVRIGAGSVVLKDIPDDCTVVGIPGDVVKHKGVSTKTELDHSDLPDPIKDEFNKLKKEIERLQNRVSELESKR